MDLLSFFALGIIVFVFLTLAYGIVAIHDIPYNMPKRAITRIKMPSMQRGWVSLFTLHAIWPFLWIWATIYWPERGYGFSSSPPVSSPPAPVAGSEAEKENKKAS
jgi:Protein of unknown function (DUF3302)